MYLTVKATIPARSFRCGSFNNRFIKKQKAITLVMGCNVNMQKGFIFQQTTH